jgi:hypothetical protein
MGLISWMSGSNRDMKSEPYREEALLQAAANLTGDQRLLADRRFVATAARSESPPRGIDFPGRNSRFPALEELDSSLQRNGGVLRERAGMK